MRKILSIILSIILTIPTNAIAQFQLNDLPLTGTILSLSKAYNPIMIQGMKIIKDNPLSFDFIINVGDEDFIKKEELKQESEALIKYFMASLTVPEEDLWVNLNPKEPDRIVPGRFGETEMGRDLLAQDYMLKQLTASLMYPEDGIGRKFWDKVYAKAYARYGHTNIEVNTFNKVWIVPEKAVVYENGDTNTVFIVESKLKVMLENDYLAQKGEVTNSESLTQLRQRFYVTP